MHILLIRFSSMGDIVLQTATINWLRALLGPELRITFVTSKEFSSLVEEHPFVNQVIHFDRKGKESWKDFKHKISQINQKTPIDLILDVHGTMRSFRLKMAFWFIPSLTVDKRRWERFFLVKFKNKYLKRLFSSTRFGMENQVERIIKDFDFIFNDMRAIERTRKFRNGPHSELTSLRSVESYPLKNSYIAISPSASFQFKRWPIDSFVQLAQELLKRTSHDIVILGGPSDDFCNAFKAIDSERLINLQGKTSLKESMSILSQAILSIGNDSGMNHIAEAYGVPCLTLFGPTDPLFGFAPHGDKSKFISKELWCRPCSTTGSKKCFRDRHYCMEMISVDEVLHDSLEILK
ncbi:MAG: glycosyltransferase family 9 protein [Bacteriovoracaceae bacterium]